VIAEPGGLAVVNKTGNPGMATAGAGDVLTGMIASLTGQGFSAWDAAVTGVKLHGLAGDLAARKIGMNSLIASDIIENIGHAA
jgi:NAD(P)H-hydrate epimerase